MLADGRHDEVIAELEALIAEQPYRERLRAQLMVALYRADRQADALEAFRAARETLLDELGLEPGRTPARAAAGDPGAGAAARRAPVRV